MWKFRIETPPFLSLIKSGLQKSYLMTLFLVGRSSKKTTWDCDTTLMLSFGNFLPTNFRRCDLPPCTPALGKDPPAMPGRSGKKANHRKVLLHPASFYKWFQEMAFAPCGLPFPSLLVMLVMLLWHKQFEFWSKQDKPAMTAITLETILRSMFSTHGTCQSLSGLKCSEVEHHHHPHHQQQHHKHNHDASKSIGPFQETDYVVKSVYRTYV